jgi:hypothetical protein
VSLPPRKNFIKRSAIKRKPRPKAETVRAHGEAERREWMTRQPCVICGDRPSVAAHLKSGGTGRKDDVERTVPMCVPHHDEFDGRKVAGGKRTFLAKYGKTMDWMFRVAALIDERWREYATTDRGFTP